MNALVVLPRALGRCVLLSACALLASCEPSTQPGPPARIGLTLTYTGPRADTVFGVPVRVRLVLRDSSLAPIANATLIYESVDTANPFGVSSVTPPNTLPALPPFTTDARGEALFELRRPTAPGNRWFRVRSPAPGGVWADSILLESLVGGPAEIMMPVDTAVFTGNSIVWRATVRDRALNVLSVPVTLEAGSAGLSVSGMTVTATAPPSRQVVRARAGTFVDSVWVSIVPQGELAVVVDRLYSESPDSAWVYARFQLDGTGYAPLVTRASLATLGLAVHLGPQYLPNGQHVIFRLGNGIGRATMAGQVESWLPAPDASSSLNCLMPDASGDTIYAHRLTNSDQSALVWRVSAPTAAVSERVSPPAPNPFYVQDLCPSPSPDGRFVAVASERGTGTAASYFAIQVIDRLDSTIASLNVPGAAPRWSPTGEWILAQNFDTLFVMRPDGSDRRVIGATSSSLEPRASWSPDGQWVVAERGGPVVELINLQSGLRLPLGWTGFMRAPVWRPTPP